MGITGRFMALEGFWYINEWDELLNHLITRRSHLVDVATLRNSYV